MTDELEKRCVFCSAFHDGVLANESGEYKCEHCGTTGRYNGKDLVAIYIPNFEQRLHEMDVLVNEIQGEIDLEAMKGPHRDMNFLQKKNRELERVNSEYSFLCYFRLFVDSW